METLEDKIKKFLAVDGSGDGDGDGYGYGDGDGSGDGSGSGYGDGYGDGYGYGYGDGYGSGYGDGDGDGDGSGDGYGSGYGDGDGYGSGSGYGDGDGYGYGDGDGLKTFNYQEVSYIDAVATLIDSVHGNYAKGKIVNSDFTTSDCFIAKEGNCFAHGKNLREAFQSAHDKAFERLPVDERIRKFKEEYPDFTVKVEASRLFDWHHILTGSCLMGRESFCRDHGIDYKDGMYSVNEFIEITEDAYGGEIIRKLKN